MSFLRKLASATNRILSCHIVGSGNKGKVPTYLFQVWFSLDLG